MIVVVSEDAVDFANAIEVGFIEPFLYKSKGFISSFLRKKRHRKKQIFSKRLSLYITRKSAISYLGCIKLFFELDVIHP
jgi:hypothetical protein